QRREMNVTGRRRIDPDDLIDLGARRDSASDIDRVDRCVHAPIRLIRGLAFEDSKRCHRVEHDAATELLVELARERSDIVLAGIALAAGLHEGIRAALAHQQHAAGVVADQRGHDPDRLAHALSCPFEEPNVAISYADSECCDSAALAALLTFTSTTSGG